MSREGGAMNNADTEDNKLARQEDSRLHLSPFETIKRRDGAGHEYWSARELAKILGYRSWDKFKNAIRKAEAACENSGYASSDHFSQMGKMIELGKGAKREIEDVHLSRYACYLIVQNADPSKEIVALGQTYFAVQTRRQELEDQHADELAAMSEAQKRLFMRRQLAEYNTKLAATARGAGVIEPRDFATFIDHGYMGLYAGERATDIHKRKGLQPNQKILDHMGFDELAANAFRSSLAEQKITREQIKGKDNANQAHQQIGAMVRKTIAEAGGTMPEELPTPAESILQLQQKEQKRQKQIEADQAKRDAGQLSLFEEKKEE